MGNKHRGEPRIYKRIHELILQGLPNEEVLHRIRKEFKSRTSAEQVRFERSNLRRRLKGKKTVLAAVAARRLWKARQPKD